MKPLAPVTSATFDRSVIGRWCLCRNVVHAIGPVHSCTELFEGRAHHHVVFENPRKLSIRNPACRTILEQLELHQLRDSGTTVFFNHTQNEDAGKSDLSLVPECLCPA